MRVNKMIGILFRSRSTPQLLRAARGGCRHATKLLLAPPAGRLLLWVSSSFLLRRLRPGARRYLVDVINLESCTCDPGRVVLSAGAGQHKSLQGKRVDVRPVSKRMEQTHGRTSYLHLVHHLGHPVPEHVELLHAHLATASRGGEMRGRCKDSLRSSGLSFLRLTSIVRMSPFESVSLSRMLGLRTFETASVLRITSTLHLRGPQSER